MLALNTDFMKLKAKYDFFTRCRTLLTLTGHFDNEIDVAWLNSNHGNTKDEIKPQANIVIKDFDPGTVHSSSTTYYLLMHLKFSLFGRMTGIIMSRRICIPPLNSASPNPWKQRVLRAIHFKHLHSSCTISISW